MAGGSLADERVMGMSRVGHSAVMIGSHHPLSKPGRVSRDPGGMLASSLGCVTHAGRPATTPNTLKDGPRDQGRGQRYCRHHPVALPSASWIRAAAGIVLGVT